MGTADPGGTRHRGGRNGTPMPVQDLLECCADKRVSVVMAKRSIEVRIEQGADDANLTRAVELLGETLHKGPWDEAA